MRIWAQLDDSVIRSRFVVSASQTGTGRTRNYIALDCMDLCDFNSTQGEGKLEDTRAATQFKLLTVAILMDLCIEQASGQHTRMRWFPLTALPQLACWVDQGRARLRLRKS